MRHFVCAAVLATVVGGCRPEDPSARIAAIEAKDTITVQEAKELVTQATKKTRRHFLLNVTTLSDEAAEVLAGLPARSLQLPRLTVLNSVPLARTLSDNGITVELNGLTTLTPEIAQALARPKTGPALYLNGLTALSDEAAKALSDHDGNLFLDGLTAISDNAAQSLAQRGGLLSLNGLKTLSDDAAYAFAKHIGGPHDLDKEFVREGRVLGLIRPVSYLHLKGLTELSPKAAARLKENFAITLSPNFEQ